MIINTAVSRRVRDALLEAAHQGGGSGGRGGIREIEDLNPEQRALLDRVLPVLETMYLMMVADRDADPIERSTLCGALKTLVGNHLADSAIDWVIAKFETSLELEGASARLQGIGASLSADREDAEGAFALAAAVAVADERIDPEEDQLLEEIREWFGISEKRATSILEEVS